MNRIIFLILMVLSVFSGCSKMGSKSDTKCEEVLLEDFINSLQDSLMMAPHATLEIYKKARETTTDSISSYKLLQQISKCYLWAGERENAMTTLRKVIDFCESQEPTRCLLLLQADVYKECGIFHSEFGEYDSTIFYAKKSYEMLMNMEKRQSLPIIYAMLAESYQRIGDYPNASFYYQRTLFVADSLNIGIHYKFKILELLAGLYRDVDNFDMAEYYYQQAEKHWDDISIPEAFKTWFYNSRGVFFMNIKDHPKALTCHKLFYQNLPLSDPFYRALGAVNIGETFMRMGERDSARHYIDRAKEYYQQSYLFPSLEFHIDGLSDLLAMKLDEAEKRLSNPQIIEFVEPKIIDMHYQLLGELYAQRNDYKKAYHYRLKSEAYNDSMRNAKIRNNVAEMEMRYRQDTTLLRKDLRIALVEGRASRWQNVASISLLAVVLISALAGVVILYSRRKREREYRRQMDTVTGLRMEIVRNRLSPHFVFNALNVMMPSLGQHRELEQNFSRLIQLLRNNLQASERIAVPLEEEINLVKNYLQLQMLSDPGRISVNWNVAGDVQEDARIPSMSIQIPVENAVKYAFTPEHKNARIDVSITRQAEAIHITIDDNGVGYQPGTGSFGERGTGSGLKMLHRTTELLNTRNHHKMKFTIENKTPPDKGMCVTVIVPLNYQFEIKK